MNNYSFKKSLNIAMAYAGVNNKQLAKATGLESSSISAYRSGWNDNPTLHTILKLAAGLDISAATLINYGEKNEEKLLRNHPS